MVMKQQQEAETASHASQRVLAVLGQLARPCWSRITR